MTITPPPFRSQLSVPVQSNNFLAVQSAKLSVTSTNSSITFTDVPGTLRITAQITNSGTKGCFISSGHSSATAVVSSSTPTPASGDEVASTCTYVAAGAILTYDFLPGTNTFAAITDNSDTTTLEISVGYGQ